MFIVCSCPHSTLSLGFTDDESARASAVEGLLTHYSAARIEYHLIDPQQYGIPAVGHMGFF